VPPQNDPHGLSGDNEDRGQFVHSLAIQVLFGHVLDLGLSESPKLPLQLPSLILLSALEKGF
jgi:hypothetical protein